MNLRRTTLKGIMSVFSSMALLPNKSLACVSAGGPPIDIFINKRYFRKFQYGKIETFMRGVYGDAWLWSKDVKIETSKNTRKSEYTFVENRDVVPIKTLYDTNYNNKEIYCSKIDIIYVDERTNALYIPASVNFSENAIPYLATRIRMSSVQAKIYTAITFRNIRSNEIHETKVSYSPAKIRGHSCAPLNVIYIDA